MATWSSFNGNDMLGHNGSPRNSICQRWWFGPNGDAIQTWTKPPNVVMVSIIVLAAGGAGHNGDVGLNSVARGGGGGGAGGYGHVLIPAFLIPDVLFMRIQSGPRRTETRALDTLISTNPGFSVAAQLMRCSSGQHGGTNSPPFGGGQNGNGFTPALALTVGVNPGASPSGGNGGAVGAAGSNGGGTNLASGGAGGGSLGAAGVAGLAGGSNNVPVSAQTPHAAPGGAGGSSATIPPGDGSNGFDVNYAGSYYLGGGGGGSSHGSATGAGLVGGNGGDGHFGCGGGGGGACLTGGTGGIGGRGGDSFVIITAW